MTNVSPDDTLCGYRYHISLFHATTPPAAVRPASALLSFPSRRRVLPSGPFVPPRPGRACSPLPRRHHALQRTAGQNPRTILPCQAQPDPSSCATANIWSSARHHRPARSALMAMVARMTGEEIGVRIRRQARTGISPARSGQSQFSPSLLELKAPTGRFGPLLTSGRANISTRRGGG